jgi:hypothetical protein
MRADWSCSRRIFPITMPARLVSSFSIKWLQA